MQLTEDSFRALARSSPWRFRTLHFNALSHVGPVEAWLRRPGWLRVIDARGQEWIERDDRPAPGRSVSAVFVAGGAAAAPATVEGFGVWKRPDEVVPHYREDGLVAERPGWPSAGCQVGYGDPMFQTYLWVAMLDPAELSHDVLLSNLREDTHYGRLVWRASAVPVEGYDPRCSCCALLWSEVSSRIEHGDYWVPSDGRVYPDAYEVALDVETGVAVSVRYVGGSHPEEQVDVEILEVDAEF